MALEIRELVVKVTIQESENKKSDLTVKERKQLVEECKKEVLRTLDKRKKR